VLQGHKNVVYAIAFNNPYGDKIITGEPRRFGADHIARGGPSPGADVGAHPLIRSRIRPLISGAGSGVLFMCQVACRRLIGSFDKTCKLWDANTGELLHTLRGHATEIVCLSFNPQVGSAVSTP
jgi:dynein assembly factor with WDR repeat domains 1